MARDLEYYEALHYRMIGEYDRKDEVYFIRFPELPGCMAHGKTEQEAVKVALEVRNEWLETAYQAGWEIPEPAAPEETSGRVTLRLPKYLHRRVIDQAEVQGVSQNQLILIFIAEGLQKTETRGLSEKVLDACEQIIKQLSGNMTPCPVTGDAVASRRGREGRLRRT